MLDNIGTGIAFGKGTCAVVADSGLVTTRDGINWTKIGAPLPQAWYGLGGGKVIFDGNMFLIVASGDTYTSTDGVTWSKFSTADTSTHWAGLQFGNGHYVAVGDTNRKASEDGQTWHDYVQGGPGFTGLAFGNGVFVAVGNNGLIETTPDGVTWTVATDTVDAGLGDLSNIVFANGAFLTCAPSSSYSICLTSTDGLTWTSHAATHAPNGPLGFGMGLYISVTWESNIWTSTDGLTWKEEFSGDAASNPLASVGFGLLGP